jgi:hypothetical protein
MGPSVLISLLPLLASGLEPAAPGGEVSPVSPASPGSPAPLDPEMADRLAKLQAERTAMERLAGRSVVVGGSFGLGAPLGWLGAFGQYNPSALWGAQLGGGLGSFGPAVSAMGLVRPAVTEDSALSVGLGWSGNLTPSSARDHTDRDLPAVSHWLNAEVSTEWRILGGRMLRFGVGHTWLLNSGGFRCRTGQSTDALGACQAASETAVPGWAPYKDGSVDPFQAVVAHEQGISTHFWYAHIDFGAIIPL